jgi:cytochrome c oxidase cbb3-type subunit 1
MDQHSGQELFGSSEAASRVIFGAKEVGLIEEPAARTAAAQDDLQETMNRTGHTGEFSILTPEEADERATQDESGRWPVLLSIGFAVLWLVLASVFGLIASIKLHMPDWLVSEAWLTFGRIRPAHLNAVAYGWCSSAAFGVALWLMPRLLRTPLVGAKTAAVGATLWGLGVISGIVAVLTGHSAGLEWLEFPWQCDVPMVIGGTMMGVALLRTLRNRRVEHLYVSVWYIAAGLIWLPILLIVANWPGLHFGVQQAAMNWWYGHNVLGLWFTPIGLAAIYYFIPKVLGKPIHSYNLSLIGFWTLAFFYSQVGGAPPDWRAGSGMAHFAVHRAEHDDDRAGDGRGHQSASHVVGTPRRAAPLTDTAICGAGGHDVYTRVGARVD